MYHSFITVDQGCHVPYTYLFGVLYSEVCMKIKTHDIDDLRKRLMQTWFDFDWNIINDDALIMFWYEIMCACWWWTL